MLTLLAVIKVVIALLWATNVYNWYRKTAPMAAGLVWSTAMSPLDYERYCRDVLRQVGWHANTTSASGDQGIDVLADKNGVHIVIQCKLYTKPVGNSAVQQALAGRAYARAHLAVVVSNASYTPSARALARRTGVHLLHHNDLLRADRLFLTS